MRSAEQKARNAQRMREWYAKKRQDPEWMEKYRKQRRRYYESRATDEEFRAKKRERVKQWQQTPQGAEWRLAYSRRADVRERARLLAAERRKDPEYRKRLNERNARFKRTPVQLAKSRERLRKYRQTPGGRRVLLNCTLKKHYGITLADYERMFAEQGGVCAICKTFRVSKSHPRLGVDHDHKTGRVRGLLCWMCNRGMGLLGDSRERMLSAAEYLK